MGIPLSAVALTILAGRQSFVSEAVIMHMRAAYVSPLIIVCTGGRLLLHAGFHKLCQCIGQPQTGTRCRLLHLQSVVSAILAQLGP